MFAWVPLHVYKPRSESVCPSRRSAEMPGARSPALWLLLLSCCVCATTGYPFKTPLDLDVTPRITILNSGKQTTTTPPRWLVSDATHSFFSVGFIQDRARSVWEQDLLISCSEFEMLSLKTLHSHSNTPYLCLDFLCSSSSHYTIWFGITHPGIVMVGEFWQTCCTIQEHNKKVKEQRRYQSADILFPGEDLKLERGFLSYRKCEHKKHHYITYNLADAFIQSNLQ